MREWGHSTGCVGEMGDELLRRVEERVVEMVLGEPLFHFEEFDGWVVGRIAHWWAFELFEARESVAEVVFEIGL